jgi:DNA gyrase subunit B
MSTDTTYTDKNIVTLKDAAHIRQNPGMYVGNTQSAGLHHLVYEIVYNSVDEALAGYCTLIRVVLHKDGSVSVSDNGRGIPIGIKPDTGKSTLEEALTIAGTSGKFDNRAYRVSAGLHGMGAKAMNALSEWCEAEVRRDGRVYKMEFERGYATGELQDLGPAPSGETGTTIRFEPDPEMFGDLSFNYDTLATRFRQIAYLNRGLTIVLANENDGKTDTFHSEGGIAEYVVFLNEGEQVEHDPIYIKKEVEGVTVEVAIQYNAGENRVEQCFTNNAYNPDGGTHLSGFRTGLTRSIQNYGKKEGIFREGIELRGEDFREGLTAVVSLGHPDPLFESQTKVKLTNPEVDGIVTSVVYEGLTGYLEKNPKEGGRICKKIQLAAEARIAARKAREALIDRKKLLAGGGLPGKLMDCSTRERDKSELFLVEGDSAGGSAEGGRNRMFQAVLPLRGKVLNVEKARPEKMLKNEEITSLITAVGVDVGNAEDLSRLRYGKVIILTDADVDGQHIRTLLLTFFFRQMRKLIEDGHVYVARPPLYKVTQKKEPRFVQTREEMTKELTDRGLTGTVLHVVKPGAAARTVAQADLTGLVPVLNEIEAAVVSLERRGHTLEAFLARAKDGVFPAYHVRFAGKEFWFHTQAEVDAFRAEQSKRLGKELVLANDVELLAGAKGEPGVQASGSAAMPGSPPNGSRYTLDEWHEVRALNRAIGKLRAMRMDWFELTDLVPLARVAGREPPVRFTLERGEARKDLSHLLELVTEVRRLGEKGITVTRFKGLGEMDADELWATTLDPANRTLLKVTLNDAIEAEKLFRMLMGEEVEGRRAYIFEHRIKNVEDIDYGA